MRKLFTDTLTATVLAFAPMLGWAMPIIETGGGFAIFDNTSDSNTITVVDNEVVDSVSITLDISHSWVGDLTISLTSPGGVADIMVRPGGGSFVDPGDGSDLGDWFYPPNTTTPTFAFNTLRYSFGDTGLPDFWGAAGAIGPNETIQAAMYQASDVTGAAVSLDAIFGGTGTQGDWTLSIADGATPDVGELVSWELNITPIAEPPGTGIPAPATLALFGLGLAGLGWSRRKQRT